MWSAVVDSPLPVVITSRKEVISMPRSVVEIGPDLIHEFDSRGNHRIVKTCCSPKVHDGAWAQYQAPAILVVHGDRFFAVTEYFADGEGLSANAIYGYQPVFDIE